MTAFTFLYSLLFFFILFYSFPSAKVQNSLYMQNLILENKESIQSIELPSEVNPNDNEYRSKENVTYEIRRVVKRYHYYMII